MAGCQMGSFATNRLEDMEDLPNNAGVAGKWYILDRGWVGSQRGFYVCLGGFAVRVAIVSFIADWRFRDCPRL